MKKLLFKLVSITTLLIAVFAMPFANFAMADFTPSVTAKPAPEVVEKTYTDENGTHNYVADIVQGTTKDDMDSLDFLTKVEVYLVGYSELDNMDSSIPAGEQQTIKTNLTAAYQSIASAPDLKGFSTELDNYAKSLNKAFTASVFTVTDLFDITIPADKQSEVKEDATKYLRITLKGNYSSYTYDPVFMHLSDGVWKVCKSQLISKTDTSITVCFDSLCPIAILAVNPEKAQAAIDKANTPSGMNWLWLIIVACVLVLIIVCVLIYMAMHRNNGKKTVVIVRKHGNE